MLPGQIEFGQLFIGSAQCKMYIAAVRIADDYGCDLIGIQYQQGLKDLLPASDLVEGTLIPDAAIGTEVGRKRTAAVEVEAPGTEVGGDDVGGVVVDSATADDQGSRCGDHRRRQRDCDNDNQKGEPTKGQ